MKTKAKIASRWLRFRALLIDIFLIYVPILYLFYFLLGSKEA
ncbi:RDD family protein, partial [Campylobacter coli]|nr:RDD family protein [Campylobacter coli]